jgi:hypothetical protein
VRATDVAGRVLVRLEGPHPIDYVRLAEDRVVAASSNRLARHRGKPVRYVGQATGGPEPGPPLVSDPDAATWPHDYPGAPANNPPGEAFTSDCRHGCGCWAGPTRSGGPEGIDPFGDCPRHPGRPRGVSPLSSEGGSGERETPTGAETAATGDDSAQEPPDGEGAGEGAS